MNLTGEVQKVLRTISPRWISLLLDLLLSIQVYVKQTTPEGLYEFLTYDFRLELLDVQGRTAYVTKHARVKFLQDNVITVSPLNQSIPFSWNAVAGAATYQIQVDISSSFGSPFTVNQSNLTQPQFAFTFTTARTY